MAEIKQESKVTDVDIEYMSEEERIELAKNAETSAELLVKLAKNEDWDVRRAVARNPNTPAESLVELADKDGFVYTVAENPNTSVELLAKLAGNKDEDIRAAVARNPSSPVEILNRLAKDNFNVVRYSVAHNPSTPGELLTKLANDNEILVCLAVASHPNTPIDLLAKLADDNNSGIRMAVSHNPSIPDGVLMKLAKDKDEHIRRAVNNNSSYRAIAKASGILIDVEILSKSVLKNQIVHFCMKGEGKNIESCLLNLNGRILMPEGFEKGIELTPENAKDFKYRDVIELAQNSKSELIDLNTVKRQKVDMNAKLPDFEKQVAQEKKASRRNGKSVE